MLPHIEEKDQLVGSASLVLQFPPQHLDLIVSHSRQQSENKTPHTILKSK